MVKALCDAAAAEPRLPLAEGIAPKLLDAA
jgi:hypothetical protein